jgi:succinate dehydrogenase (ubiquinone) membrane anchor subunit
MIPLARRCFGRVPCCLSFPKTARTTRRINYLFLYYLLIMCFVGFQLRCFSSSPTSKGENNANLSLSGEPINAMHGSNHWSFERAVSVATFGLIGAAAAYPHPMVNFALGAVIPLHLYIGFGAIITDYLPHRKFPVIYRFSRGVLYACTALTFYGLYRFNTEDVGIIEGVKALWTAKKFNNNDDLNNK